MKSFLDEIMKDAPKLVLIGLVGVLMFAMTIVVVRNNTEPVVTSIVALFDFAIGAVFGFFFRSDNKFAKPVDTTTTETKTMGQ